MPDPLAHPALRLELTDERLEVRHLHFQGLDVWKETSLQAVRVLPCDAVHAVLPVLQPVVLLLRFGVLGVLLPCRARARRSCHTAVPPCVPRWP